MDVVPCKIACFGYPGDPHYAPSMHFFFLLSLYNAVLVNSKSDFKNYSKPLDLAQSAPLQGLYNLGACSKREIMLKQIVAETDDGFILRNKRKNVGLTYKSM